MIFGNEKLAGIRHSFNIGGVYDDEEEREDV
jgi:hypothetical protein